ncbi:MAG: diguanylate cyclase [Alphaproteobacteria bacterium]|nr:diguanylate cyclase [Alphaproteobacteria bacterium]
MDQTPVIIISILSSFLCTFVVISFVLVHKIRQLRHRLNALLEENAKKTVELDEYLQSKKQPLGTLFNQGSKGLIMQMDANGKIKKANDTLYRILGFNKNDLIGKNAVGTIFPIPEKNKNDIVKRIFANPKLFTECETESLRKDKSSVWIAWTNRFIYDKKNHPIEVNAVGFDISKRKELEAELKYMSSMDPQTGVLNRTALLETGTIELKRAMRYKRDLSIAIIKIKHKNTGDFLSDNFTDTVLHNLIQMFRKVMRSVDYLGRIGDVEFAMILPETQASNLPFLIQRINEHLLAYNDKANLKNSVEIMYGAAAYTKPTDTIDSLLHQADLNLQQKERQSKKQATATKRRRQ